MSDLALGANCGQRSGRSRAGRFRHARLAEEGVEEERDVEAVEGYPGQGQRPGRRRPAEVVGPGRAARFGLGHGQSLGRTRNVRSVTACPTAAPGRGPAWTRYVDRQRGRDTCPGQPFGRHVRGDPVRRYPGHVELVGGGACQQGDLAVPRRGRRPQRLLGDDVAVGPRRPRQRDAVPQQGGETLDVLCGRAHRGDRLLHGQDRLGWHLLQGRPVQRRDAHVPGHPRGHGADAFRGLHERRTAAHARRAAEQAAGRRDAQQCGAGRATRRLTGDRHPAGVSAEGRDVVLYPFQRADPVAHGPVGRSAGHLEEALGAEPVVDADRTTPSRANGQPRYQGEALQPPKKPPPWIQTSTGRPAASRSGVKTFRFNSLSPAMIGSGISVITAIWLR